jgi:hypothetical protein
MTDLSQSIEPFFIPSQGGGMQLGGGGMQLGGGGMQLGGGGGMSLGTNNYN